MQQHDWKPGDRAMVEVEVKFVNNKGDVRIDDAYGHSLWLPRLELRPVAPDWRETWEEETKGGYKCRMVVQCDGNTYGICVDSVGNHFMVEGKFLIPKHPPKPEKKWRPWTAEEARGKWVRNKRNKSILLITGISELGTFHLDGVWWKPVEVLDEFEQLNSEPCGILE